MYFKRKVLFIIVLVMFIGFSFSLDAQASKKAWWFNAGLGAGSVEDNSAALNLSFSYQFGKHLISLRTAGCGGLFTDSFSDVAALYGWSTSPGQFQASASAGIGFFRAAYSSGLFSEVTVVEGIGFPLEFQLSWRPLSFLGVSCYGFGNINGEESFFGVTLGVQFGKLK